MNKLPLISGIIGVCCIIGYFVMTHKSVVKPTTNYWFEQDSFDPGLGRYIVKIVTMDEQPNEEAMKISEYERSKRDKGPNFIFFFTKWGCEGSAYLRVDLPKGTAEKCPLICK